MIPDRLELLISEDLPPRQLAELFRASGHNLYLVGGSVRDAFLERPVEDFDFTTSARPDAILELLERWADAVYTVGARFGTVAAIKGGHSIEVTTFRDDVYRDDSRKPRVSFSDDIETDLSRRDFTVNSIAISLPEMETVDPYGGLADLAGRRLRTPSDPEVSFSDDPLRMLRLFRFQATLDFVPAQETLDAVSEMGERMEIVSPERIRDELNKLMVAPAPGKALLDMVQHRLTESFLPELPALAMEQDPAHHHKDVLAHTAAVVDKTSPDLVLRLAALFHDVGKPETREFGTSGVSFHHHEVVGARLTRRRMRAMRYPNDTIESVASLVYLHLRPHTLDMGWTDSAVRRYVRDAGPLLERLNELVRCDVTTANKRRESMIQDRLDDLEDRIRVLGEQEELARLRPPINGNQVMRYLGIDPGPQVGEIMSLLLEKRIEDGPYSSREAYDEVRQWALRAGLADPGDAPEEEE